MKETALHNNRSALVLLIALLASFLPVLLVITQVTGYTHGLFIYPVDDTFIHMQVAKNLAAHGTWGINAGEFGSASSSILYTLLLSALFKIFGPALYLPLIVNGIAAIFLLIALRQWLQRQQLGAGAQLLTLLLVVFFAPLPVLVLSGMEHTLQCLFAFLFISRFSDWSGNGNEKEKLPASLLLWAVLTATIRYEGLFLIAAACLVLAVQKKWSSAFQLGFIACLPVLLFGCYSLSRGSYFLPNSVLVKSEAAQFSLKGLMQAASHILIEKFTFAHAGITLLATQRLLLLLPLLFLAFAFHLKQHKAYRIFLTLLLAAVLLHLAFADTGKFYRYEAYLVLCAVAIASVLVHRYARTVLMPHRSLCLLLFVFLFLLVFPLVLRSTAAFSKSRQACINIYEQQYQMAQFTHRYYQHAGIAANDIGAVSYFNEAHLLDLWGLANIEVARSKKGGYWTASFLDSLAQQKKTKIAMVYDSWIGSSLPPRWKKIAAWQISNNVVCGDDIVSFYAIDTAGAEALKNNLRAFRPSLPPTVKVTDYE